MTDRDLMTKLKSVQPPARSDEYWEEFPQVVAAQLRLAPIFRKAAKPIWPGLAWLGGLGFACLLAMGLFGFVHSTLKNERVFRHELAQLPVHLRMLMADEHGLHYLVKENE